MSTRKRVSRRGDPKREPETLLQDEEMEDDALEKAEALLKQRKKATASPKVSKLATHPQKKLPKPESKDGSEDDSSEEQSDYDSEEVSLPRFNRPDERLHCG